MERWRFGQFRIEVIIESEFLYRFYDNDAGAACAAVITRIVYEGFLGGKIS
jgi:hypothetical protein